jgi:hypothetical protein
MLTFTGANLEFFDMYSHEVESQKEKTVST